MSHDEIGGTVTRKERRKEFGGKRVPKTRRLFSAADHIRNDWTPDEIMVYLEGRAAGYNGLLRNFLCTAAHQLRVAGATIDRLEAALAEQMTEVEVPVVSKRNQQPGRLSGSEREALEDLLVMAMKGVAPTDSEKHWEEVTTMGRKLLAKVRKRALGGGEDEFVDASALMPVGVEDPPIGFENADGVPQYKGDPVGVESEIVIGGFSAKGGGS